MPTQTKQPPRLRNLDELFNVGTQQDEQDSAPQLSIAADTEFAIIPFELMDDYPKHPFRLYTGERESDMIEAYGSMVSYSRSYSAPQITDGIRYYPATIASTLD